MQIILLKSLNRILKWGQWNVCCLAHTTVFKQTQQADFLPVLMNFDIIVSPIWSCISSLTPAMFLRVPFLCFIFLNIWIIYLTFLFYVFPFLQITFCFALRMDGITGAENSFSCSPGLSSRFYMIHAKSSLTVFQHENVQVRNSLHKIEHFSFCPNMLAWLQFPNSHRCLT